MKPQSKSTSLAGSQHQIIGPNGRIWLANGQVIKQNNFYIDPGGPGGHPGGSRTDSEAENIKRMDLFKILSFFLSRQRAENIKKNEPPSEGFKQIFKCFRQFLDLF